MKNWLINEKVITSMNKMVNFIVDCACFDYLFSVFNRK